MPIYSNSLNSIYWKVSFDKWKHRNGDIYEKPGYILLMARRYFLDPDGGGEYLYKLQMKNSDRAIRFLRFCKGEIEIPLKTVLSSLHLVSRDVNKILTIYGSLITWKTLKKYLPNIIPEEVLEAYSPGPTSVEGVSISKGKEYSTAEFKVTPYFFGTWEFSQDLDWDDHFEEYTKYGVEEADGELTFCLGFPSSYESQMMSFILYLRRKNSFDKSPIDIFKLEEDQTLFGLSIILAFSTEVFNDGHNYVTVEENECDDEQYPWASLPEEILDIFS